MQGHPAFHPRISLSRLNISRYGVEVLLDAGLSMGIVMMQDEKYILTKTGFFILKDSMTQVNMDFVHDVCYEPFFFLEESVESGKPEGLKVFGDWKTIYPGLQFLPEQAKKSWFGFDHYYSDVAFPEIIPLIASGNPSNLNGCGRKYRQICHAVCHTDSWPGGDHSRFARYAYKQRKNYYRKGSAGQDSFSCGRYAESENELPKGFDAIWMSQFLDCFSEEEITASLPGQSGQWMIILPLYTGTLLGQAEIRSFFLQPECHFALFHLPGQRQQPDVPFGRYVPADRTGRIESGRITDHIGISHTLVKMQKKVKLNQDSTLELAPIAIPSSFRNSSVRMSFQLVNRSPAKRNRKYWI